MTLNIKIVVIPLILLFSTACAASDTDSEHVKEIHCAEIIDCNMTNNVCNNTIGFFYNDTIGECVINIKLLLKSLTTKYDTQDKIRLEVLSVFQGVIISVILFVTCTSLCVLGACVYCCRINYIMIYYYTRVVDYAALFTFLVILTMSIACCTWCYCIRAHDKAMQHYIVNLAKKKGLEIEPYTLPVEPCSQSPHANENCSIYVPDVGIIL